MRNGNIKQTLLSHLKNNTQTYLQQLRKYSQYTRMLTGTEIIKASMYYFQANEDLSLLDGIVSNQYLVAYNNKLDSMTTYANQVITKNINKYKN